MRVLTRIMGILLILLGLFILLYGSLEFIGTMDNLGNAYSYEILSKVLNSIIKYLGYIALSILLMLAGGFLREISRNIY